MNLRIFTQNWVQNIFLVSRGVGVFLSNKLHYKVIGEIVDDYSNYVNVDITKGETRFTRVTLYDPYEDNHFFDNIIFIR
jgi:hypothetical protein